MILFQSVYHLVLFSMLYNQCCFDAALMLLEFWVFTIVKKRRGIQVDASICIVNKKRNSIIDIILVSLPLGFIVRALWLELFLCHSIPSNFCVFTIVKKQRGIQVDVSVWIVNNKRNFMIDIILVCVPLGFIIRTLWSDLLWWHSMPLDFRIFPCKIDLERIG